MNTFLLTSCIVLWLAVLGLAFLLLGALRSVSLLSWRLDQLETTMPSRIERNGLKPGKHAPDFTLPCAHGGEASLHDFAGRRVLLVFVQTGCGPCGEIVPELNRLQSAGHVQVLAVSNGDLDATRGWASAAARFPVLAQENLSVSKRYQVFATPFAFVIDETGRIASKGICGNAQHLGFVLNGAERKQERIETPSDAIHRGDFENARSDSQREVTHV